MTAFTFTETLSRVMTSCGGTCSAVTRMSMMIIRSMKGMIHFSPAVRTPDEAAEPEHHPLLVLVDDAEAHGEPAGHEGDGDEQSEGGHVRSSSPGRARTSLRVIHRGGRRRPRRGARARGPRGPGRPCPARDGLGRPRRPVARRGRRPRPPSGPISLSGLARPRPACPGAPSCSFSRRVRATFQPTNPRMAAERQRASARPPRARA